MTGLTRHMLAAAHPMLRRLQRRVATNRQSDSENGRRDDQDKAARQRRDHDVKVMLCRGESTIRYKQGFPRNRRNDTKIKNSRLQ
jgi:hypothetical protein